MATLDLYLFPHPVLREKCETVTEFDAELHRFLDDMGETMYAANGVGLAAPQVGVAKQITVIDASSDHREGSLVELINPKIVVREGKEVSGQEGCLSIPDIYESVTRHPKVVVEAQNRHGENFTIEGEELLAVALQHEIDHLQGVLFIDYLSRFKQGLIQRKMRKRFGKQMIKEVG